jgi:predicted O-methyltransferase YrrM
MSNFQENIENKIELETKQIYRMIQSEFRQLESLLNLHSLIKPVHPLPSFRGWTIRADSAVIIYSLIKERGVKKILELGSGASSLIMAYALQDLGQGNIVSLEHDKKYIQESRSMIDKHGLDRYCTVHYSPLVETRVEDIVYKFYSTDHQHLDDLFDMILVDGPPAPTNPMARFPALPVFYEKLRKGGLVILDDARRKDEKMAVKKWLSTYTELKNLSVPETEKGISVLVKN